MLILDDTAKLLSLMREKIKQEIAQTIGLACKVNPSTIVSSIQVPKNTQHGDLALPCFALAKGENSSPPEFAQQLSNKLTASSTSLPLGVQAVVPTGPFLNFRLDRGKYTTAVTNAILANGPLAEWSRPESQDIVLEYSSPNIAKTFHVGHLRGTIIGSSLERVHKLLGNRVVSINHLGDWGTQFGFVWAGCELWGRPSKDSVHALVNLYKEATALKDRQEQEVVSAEDQAQPNVNDMAKNYFLALEAGEDYAVTFWQWCLDVSLEYLKETYERLNVSFNHYIGESFYSDKLEHVKSDLEKSGILIESKGALGIDLGDKLGFARVFTPDGRSLYLTRDIASADYRHKEFGFDRAIYVVGAPQSLHFQQLIAIMKALGRDYAENIEHVAFGHVLGMKTRGSDKTVELNDFLDEAYDRALNAYNDQVSKRPEGLDEKEVAASVALSAIRFSTLKTSRQKDVQFQWDQALAFQGDSGPYMLYACARINGVKEKAKAAGISLKDSATPNLLHEESAFQLASILDSFPEVLEVTARDSELSNLTTYGLDVAKALSKAYLELKVIDAEPETAQARLALFQATQIVLQTTIELLGCRTLERM